MESKKKEKGFFEKIFGRRNARCIKKEVDPMHALMPIMWPDRADNEACISETVDLTNVKKYLEKKNADNPDYKYNLYQVIVTAMLKTVLLRPRLNYFIANQLMYERDYVSTAFTVKRRFADDASEGLAVVKAKEDETIDDIHNYLYHQITKERDESNFNTTTESARIFSLLPGWLLRFVGIFLRLFDRLGWLPNALIEADPYQNTFVVSNIGSIGLNAGFHHLTNWGTTSLFLIIGEMYKKPYYNEDGSVEFRDAVDLNLTIDERIADGYYYSKSIRLLMKILQNPELLDRPLGEEVDYQ
ncbi:MAG: 2-oxo acid dehydrogenase subunit E2 [Eubacteriales bacterium]|nr:2-oxo acid dehydrogenase subunit E2 [Eubacteriales bacterium]